MSEPLEHKYVTSDYMHMTIALGDNNDHKGYFDNWLYMVIGVYHKQESPYGWTKRKLNHKPFGFERKDFKQCEDIRLYIETAVKHVYNNFPEEEIEEFYNRVIAAISWI